MNACDVVGYVNPDGDIFCKACFTKMYSQWEIEECNQGEPIFADSEWDYYPGCTRCNELIDQVKLTDDGIKYQHERYANELKRAADKLYEFETLYGLEHIFEG